MAKIQVFLCLCLCQMVLSQFGFFNQRQGNGPLSGLFQGANRIREGLSGIFKPQNQPAVQYPTTNIYTDSGLVHFPDNSQYQNPYFGQNPNLQGPGIAYNPPIQGIEEPNQGITQFNQGNTMPIQGFTQPDQGFTQADQGYTQQNQGIAQPNSGYQETNQVIYEQNQGSTQPDQPEQATTQCFMQPIQGNGVPSTTTVSATAVPTAVSTTAVPTTVVPTTAVPTTTLPPLTPLPDPQSRNSGSGASWEIASENICTTTKGTRMEGKCISVLQCAPYKGYLEQSRSNPTAIQKLREVHCGFDGNTPTVCCPPPGIPSTPHPSQTTTTTSTTTTTPVPAPLAKASSDDFVPSLLDAPYCGVSNASLGRVVGGVDAKLGDFPWMAVLGYKNRRSVDMLWACGGSLISSKHVLTAAHCVHNHENDLQVVRLGDLDLSSDDDGATPVDVVIKAKIKHENYSSTTFANDIAILVLEKEVQFTDLIKPICIPKQVELRAKSFEDYTPLVAGWGQLNFRGPSSSRLQVVQLPVLSNEYCAQAYRQYKSQVIDERTLCAGHKKGGKDACKGDSGGPLIQPIWSQETQKTYFYQTGVVSYGKGCAEAGFPGVYSRVTHFVPWITKTITGQAAR